MALEPTCPDNCADVVNSLPAVLFDDCNPETNAGEIEKIYLGIRGQGFTGPTTITAAEFTTRFAATDETKLLALTVIGDKPKPAENSKVISGGRKQVLQKQHVVNFLIDETNITNHEFVRKNQCSGNYQGWYETSGGLLFGGVAGLPVFVEIDMNIPRERNNSIVYEGTMSWDSKYTEERQVSPVA